MNRKKSSESARKRASKTRTVAHCQPLTRTSGGRFAKGNPGGPGRPKASEEAHRHFLRLVNGIVQRPERFSDFQRDAIVRLATSFMDGSSDRQAIAAASVLVKMEQVNIERGW